MHIIAETYWVILSRHCIGVDSTEWHWDTMSWLQIINFSKMPSRENTLLSILSVRTSFCIAAGIICWLWRCCAESKPHKMRCWLRILNVCRLCSLARALVLRVWQDEVVRLRQMLDGAVPRCEPTWASRCDYILRQRSACAHTRSCCLLIKCLMERATSLLVTRH